MKNALAAKIEKHYFKEYFGKALGPKKIHRVLKLGVPQLFGLAGWVLGGLAISTGAPVLGVVAVACKLMNLPLTGILLAKARVDAKRRLSEDMEDLSLLTRYKNDVLEKELDAASKKADALSNNAIDKKLRKEIFNRYRKEYTYKTKLERHDPLTQIGNWLQKKVQLHTGILVTALAVNAALVGLAIAKSPLADILFSPTFGAISTAVVIISQAVLLGQHLRNVKSTNALMDADIQNGSLTQRYAKEVVGPSLETLKNHISIAQEHLESRAPLPQSEPSHLPERGLLKSVFSFFSRKKDPVQPAPPAPGGSKPNSMNPS